MNDDTVKRLEKLIKWAQQPIQKSSGLYHGTSFPVVIAAREAIEALRAAEAKVRELEAKRFRLLAVMNGAAYCLKPSGASDMADPEQARKMLTDETTRFEAERPPAHDAGVPFKTDTPAGIIETELDKSFQELMGSESEPESGEPDPKRLQYKRPGVETERHQVALTKLRDAMRKVEALEICRIDVGMQTEDEYQAIRALVGVLEDFAGGYVEDGPQPRLSDRLTAIIDRQAQ